MRAGTVCVTLCVTVFVALTTFGDCCLQHPCTCAQPSSLRHCALLRPVCMQLHDPGRAYSMSKWLTDTCTCMTMPHSKQPGDNINQGSHCGQQQSLGMLINRCSLPNQHILLSAAQTLTAERRPCADIQTYDSLKQLPGSQEPSKIVAIDLWCTHANLINHRRVSAGQCWRYNKRNQGQAVNNTAK